MGPAVCLRSAVALAGRFPVLAGVDLDVARGEVVLLRGANGAGKTSLLRACAGLLPITAGSAEVLGHDLVADRRAARRETGLYGHATSLYEDLSVLDNVRFAVQAARGPVAGVDPALVTLGLTGRLRGAAVSTLSAGQRRRAALAVLLARSPALWLLDEPHAGLDADHRDLLDTLLRRAASTGTTVLLASHELDRAEAIADRTVTVAGGMVTEDTGPTRQVGTATAADLHQPGPAAIHPAQLQGVGGDPDHEVVRPDGEAVGGAQPRRRDRTTELSETTHVG